jgi:tRNA pseudouridine38-40 synthase
VPVYRLDLAYDGSPFSGYASQVGHRTVQGDLEEALETILKLPLATSVAGRTDAGVHARGQVVSFEAGTAIDTNQLRRSLNGILGPEISVQTVTEAGDGFNARHSARWRRYRYRIDSGLAPDPLTRGFTWHVGRTLDVSAMSATLPAFRGEHDFSAFCRSVDDRSNTRNVEELDLAESGHVIEVWIRANAFCHQMVRSIVGYLYDVGRGFSDGSLVASVLAGRDRSAVATVAPPHGLTLWEVGY